MAIGIHVAKRIVYKDPTTGLYSHRIKADGSLANTANNPTLEEYLALEFADDYLVNLMTPNMIVTASVADANNAGS